jgi:leucine proline-enriched proteoglycan (leprecan)
MVSSTSYVPTRKQSQDISRDNSINRRRSRGLVRHSKKLVAFGALIALVLFAQTGGRAAPGEALGLSFFTSFSVTGGYKVAGVDLAPSGAVVDPVTGQSFVTGTIQMIDVPPNADILAAYLYWETITNGDPAAGSVGAQFRGQNITVDHAVSNSSDDLEQAFSPCWTQGGGGANLSLTMYRADVLQLLPPEFDANGISTGRRLANGSHTVKLPEAGTGNQTPQSAGASLLVVYRSPSASAALTRVVVYDGLYVQIQGTAFEHTIRGFFDAANSNPVISMTHIVGSGADNNNDRVYFNSSNTPVTPNGQTSPLNVFKRTSGGTSDRGWSNPTFEGLSFPQNGQTSQNSQNDSTYGEWVTTRVDHGGQNSPNDCLAWAAVVFSTTGQDQDGDGLLDKEETADNLDPVTNTRYGFKDPNEVLLPPLKRMGALPTKRDMFVHVAAMKAVAGTTYGSVDAPLKTTAIDCVTGLPIPDSPSVVDCDGHNHMISPVAAAMVGQMFAAAPAAGSVSAGIALHLDVGNPANYFALFPGLTPAQQAAANVYLVGNGSGDNVAEFAKGGQSIDEGPCAGPCPFPDYPGTVTWKTGLGLYKKALLPPAREGSWRFGLYAHAKGTHKSPFPCLDSSNNPTGLAGNGQCAVAPNPQFYVPRGISGSADFPGGDYLVTLGFFDNTTLVGDDFVVASTTAHEIGHTIGLGHGGTPLPNCKPNYVSAMNYTYQLGGAVDAAGISHLVFSSGGNDDVSEAGLTDQYAAEGVYRLSWFAPKPLNDNRKVLKRFCTGQSFDPANHPGDWIRVDGGFFPNGAPKVDWNANGSVELSGSQDVNFDGVPDVDPPIPAGPAMTDHNVWASLRLNQVGSARAIFGFSIGSPLKWDGTTITGEGTTITGEGTTRFFVDGTTITGEGATLKGDGSVLHDAVTITGDGTTITGEGATLPSDGAVTTVNGTTITGEGTTITGEGTTITGEGTLVLPNGTTITGEGVVITGEGVATTDQSALSSNHNETSTRGAAESGNLPGPRQPTVCVIGVGGCANPGVPAGVVALHRHRLDFLAPTWTPAPISTYSAYRSGPDQNDKLIGSTPNASQLWIVDTEELPQGQSFVYYIVANLADANVSGRSVEVTQVAQNDPPIAGTNVIANTYAGSRTAPLTIGAPGVLGNDTAGADSHPANLKAVPPVTGQSAQGGTVTLNADGSFTYTPGLKTTGNSDSFKYRANNGPWSGKPTIPLSADSGEVTVTIQFSGPNK